MQPPAERPAQSYAVAAEDAGERLDAFLARVSGLSRSQIQRHIREGCARLNGEPATPSRALRAGDRVEHAPPPPPPIEAAPEAIPLVIVYEDAHLAVVDKPAGLVVHPAAGHWDGTLVNALLHHCRDIVGVGAAGRPGIVHRLDKDTTGLLVVAKTEAAHVSLSAQFAARGVEREYRLLCWGAPAEAAGVFENPIARDPRDRLKFTSRLERGRRAVTRWRLVARLGPFGWLRARLSTGRTHQIRVHFADAGLPLAGDALYGTQRRERCLTDGPLRAALFALDRQALHAATLGFDHPLTGERLRFASPLPADLAAVLDRLRRLYGDWTETPWGEGESGA